MFTSFTDEQFEDLLKSKSSREILYKIYMYVKGDKLPQDLKKLVDDKIARRGCFINTAYDMLYMFNNEELLKREDIHQIFESIINAPQPKRDYIVNAFKEVDLSKRDSVVEFINIILKAIGDKQAEYVYKTYLAIMKKWKEFEFELDKNELFGLECGHDNYTYKEDKKMLLAHINGLKNNIIGIIRIIAEVQEEYKSKLIYELVTESTDLGDKDYRSYASTFIASLPNVVAVSELLANAGGYEQAKQAGGFYKGWSGFYKYPYDIMGESVPVYEYRFKSNPNVELEFIDIIAKAAGPIQAVEARKSFRCWPDSDAEILEKLSKMRVIAGWENSEQVPFLKSCFRYNTSEWLTYASKIPLLEKLCEKYADVALYIVSRVSDIDTSEIIETFLNAETKYLNEARGWASEIFNSKYALKYLEILLKAKDKLTFWLILVHLCGVEKIYNLESENPECSQFFELDRENKLTEYQLRVIINILKESGLGFATNLDDEKVVERLERLVNSQETIEVTLKELMKLPIDAIEPILESAPDEIGADDKILLFNKINEE